MSETNQTPRRIHMSQWTHAERAIANAVDAVEDMEADERLTRAVILLVEAREAVADYVDGVPAKPAPTQVAGAITPEDLDAIRAVVREEIAIALEAHLPSEQDEPDPAPLFAYTPEIEQWYREHPLTQLTEGGGSRPLEPLEWAETQTNAMLETPDGTWRPDEQLNWQSRAFRKLWFEQGSLRDEGFSRAYLVYAYYASRAGDHPDWNTEGTAAHTVRLAREKAIEAQRERQGRNPA